MADGRTGGWTDGERRDSPLPCGTADKTIGYYRVFPRECCGGGRTRSYSASCLSIRLTRPRVWSLLFIGAETLVISQFSYNAVLRGRGLSRFSPVRCQFVRAGRAMRCAVALGEGEKWLWCICQETAEQCGGVAAFNRSEFVRGETACP